MPPKSPHKTCFSLKVLFCISDEFLLMVVVEDVAIVVNVIVFVVLVVVLFPRLPVFLVFSLCNVESYMH